MAPRGRTRQKTRMLPRRSCLGGGGRARGGSTVRAGARGCCLAGRLPLPYLSMQAQDNPRSAARPPARCCTAGGSPRQSRGTARSARGTAAPPGSARSGAPPPPPPAPPPSPPPAAAPSPCARPAGGRRHGIGGGALTSKWTAVAGGTAVRSSAPPAATSTNTCLTSAAAAACLASASALASASLRSYSAFSSSVTAGRSWGQRGRRRLLALGRRRPLWAPGQAAQPARSPPARPAPAHH